MTTGRELDALVAEKLMEWDVGDIFYDETHQEVMPRVPYFSTSIADAWPIVEKYGLGVVPCSHFEDGKPCGMPTAGTPEALLGIREGPITSAPTAPLAICLAGLQCEGIELPI